MSTAVCTLNLPTIAKLQKSRCQPSTQTDNPMYTFTRAGHSFFCWVLWCTHFARNSYTAVYSSLCKLPAVKCFTFIVAMFDVRCLFGRLCSTIPGWAEILSPAIGRPIIGLKICLEIEERELAWRNSLYFVEQNFLNSILNILN